MKTQRQIEWYILHPKSEIDDRIKRLQSRMGNIDGTMLFHAVDMCYFSGTLRTAWSIFPGMVSP
jgi:hypothetical protein